MVNRTLIKNSKFTIPNQFTLTQALELLYIIIEKQYGNLKIRYAKMEEGIDVSVDDVTKLYKATTSLLDDLYVSLFVIEDCFKCDNLLNRETWANTEVSHIIDDFFILNEDIRVARLNSKAFLLEHRNRYNFLQKFNALGINKSNFKKDDEEEEYIFREAREIRRYREIKQTNEIKNEREKQVLLEKTIELRLRNELQKEFEKKLETERKKLINKYASLSKAMEPIKPKSTVKNSKGSGSLPPPPPPPSANMDRASNVKLTRRSLEVSKALNDQTNNINSQRTSFDIHDIGRAANLAWTSNSGVERSNINKSKNTSLPRRTRSSEAIKSNYEAIKVGIQGKSISSQNKVATKTKQENLISETRKISKQSVKPKTKGNPSKLISDNKTNGNVAMTGGKEDTTKSLLEIRIAQVMKSLVGVDKGACELILNNILVQNDVVHWDDIAGLNSTKEALKEAVEYPFLRPDLFMGLREPISGLLLFGPPGTGKTMVAKAVATESNSTFFSISASSLLSKYLGESEKLIKALFYLAKKLAPSIIFIDEIDSLLTSRSANENESSRRIKTELLIKWSSISNATTKEVDDESEDNRVLVLGATNLPWEIDEAARRRFTRRLYIPLPGLETRLYHLKKLLQHQKHHITDEQFLKIAEYLDGYSGSDITALAKESAMGPIRELEGNLLDVNVTSIRGVTEEDFLNALNIIKKSVSSKSLDDYERWSSSFGSSGD
ncbi:hypothetical protein TPHA_0I01900 [Tetrapisispora phaffii CBS 4417]|uniref:AAA+ ATPase domain-containing protein n=1 Tax=Tetrapisispora phaffii (strain ATCC 24235 / CBS 4417 / NBRC 1672 / NRRL Y-8282 / UCD 70-5) TaxID=1071381 RepID=G8BXR6_TETPH|nr:hypothetical protein TPHA_0I01900 [Tetrapisispora phaffii CBS 4417]CCE64694.1 hypothetical protein TPHA_0I01900 [Tetrapisispora phaffii CBS 4417]